MAERRRSRSDEGGEDTGREASHRRLRGKSREDDEAGDDPARHARIQARRWLGSPPPTAERYARALRQWRALPGAVIDPGTGMVPGSDPSPESTKSVAMAEDRS